MGGDQNYNLDNKKNTKQIFVLLRFVKINTAKKYNQKLLHSSKIFLLLQSSVIWKLFWITVPLVLVVFVFKVHKVLPGCPFLFHFPFYMWQFRQCYYIKTEVISRWLIETITQLDKEYFQFAVLRCHDLGKTHDSSEKFGFFLGKPNIEKVLRKL